MELQLKGKNLYIVDKKPQLLYKVENNGVCILLKSEKDEILQRGSIRLEEDVHVCLYCRRLKNITFVVKRGKNFEEEIFCGTMILAEEEQFEKILEMITTACPKLQMSEQNAKINGYAVSVLEKLKEGITVTIMETKEEKVKCCPVCGMECDPNIPYCMECGVPV